MRDSDKLTSLSGANIRNIIVQCGGPDDRSARIVRFPPQDSPESKISVEGPKALVEKIVARLEEFAADLENRVTEVIEVAPPKHFKIIGRGGDVRRNIESKFGVGIEIPKKDTPGPAGSKVKVSGTAANVENAKAHILDLVAEQEGETIQVPRSLHHRISDNGQFFRRLRNDHGVTVDHAGNNAPPRPTAPRTRGRANEGSLPLITDDAPNANTHSWELVEHDATAEGSDDSAIPWILRGPAGERGSRSQAAGSGAGGGAEAVRDRIPDPAGSECVPGRRGSRRLADQLHQEEDGHEGAGAERPG